MIVVFEGAPASGKTTLARRLAGEGFTRIPESNELFVRPHPEEPDWYLETQLSRWELAQCDSGVSILDGDVLQPIWFSWMYPDRVIQDWRYALEFYSKNQERIGVADRVYLLKVTDCERRRRERERCQRRGINEAKIVDKINKYAGFAGVQDQYFTKLSSQYPGWVLRLDPRTAMNDIQTAAGQYCEKPKLFDLLETIRSILNELSCMRFHSQPKLECND